jgi:hypothetical protein
MLRAVLRDLAQKTLVASLRKKRRLGRSPITFFKEIYCHFRGVTEGL